MEAPRGAVFGLAAAGLAAVGLAEATAGLAAAGLAAAGLAEAAGLAAGVFFATAIFFSIEEKLLMLLEAIISKFGQSAIKIRIFLMNFLSAVGLASSLLSVENRQGSSRVKCSPVGKEFDIMIQRSSGSVASMNKFHGSTFFVATRADLQAWIDGSVEAEVDASGSQAKKRGGGLKLGHGKRMSSE